jgi:hypothetical protein
MPPDISSSSGSSGQHDEGGAAIVKPEPSDEVPGKALQELAHLPEGVGAVRQGRQAPFGFNTLGHKPEALNASFFVLPQRDFVIDIDVACQD